MFINQLQFFARRSRGAAPPQLPAFAVMVGSADRGRIPLRPRHCCAKTQEFNFHLFIEKPREFIDICRIFRKFRPRGKRRIRRRWNAGRPVHSLSSSQVHRNSSRLKRAILPGASANPVTPNAGKCGRRPGQGGVEKVLKEGFVP